jgi:predicted O-methyltransferase YrrM
VNPVVEEIFATSTVRTASGEEIPLHSNLPRDECEVVQGWIRARRPRTVLEVGMAFGVSSLVIAEALAEVGGASHHIIDPHQRGEWRGVGIANLERAGYDGRYVLYEEPSELCLPRLLAEGFSIDFALVDGWHSFDQVLVDFYYLNRMTSPGGAIAFDDLQLPSIAKVVAHVATYDCYWELEPPASCRRSVTARARRLMGTREFRVAAFEKVAPDVRNWDWYREF